MNAIANLTYRNIKHVKSDTTHVLFSADTFFCCPLEGGNARILDFVEVLYSFGDIDHQVGTSSIGAETPNLPGIGNIPTKLVSHNTGTGLEIVTGRNLAVLDSLGELLVYGHRLDVETIVLVLRLGQGDNGRLSPDGLAVGHNGVGDLEGNTGVVFLEIL